MISARPALSQSGDNMDILQDYIDRAQKETMEGELHDLRGLLRNTRLLLENDGINRAAISKNIDNKLDTMRKWGLARVKFLGIVLDMKKDNIQVTQEELSNLWTIVSWRFVFDKPESSLPFATTREKFGKYLNKG